VTRPFAYVFAALSLAVPAAAAPVDLGWEPEIHVTHAEWSAHGMASLADNGAGVDVLMPEWLQVGERGGLVVNEGHVREETLRALANAGADPVILPVLNHPYGMADPQAALAYALATPERRAALAGQVLDFVAGEGYPGVTLALWGQDPGLADEYRDFTVEISERFAPLGLRVHHLLPAEADMPDMSVVSARADAVVVVDTGGAWDRFAEADAYDALLATWLEAVPADKLVFGLPNGARAYEGGKPLERAGVLEAFEWSRRSGRLPVYDPRNATSDLFPGGLPDVPDAVGIADAATAHARISATAPHRIRGLALHRLGEEDPSLWSLLGGLPVLDPARIATIDANYSVMGRGRGEAMLLAALPETGRREVDLSGDGRRILDSRLLRVPHGYEIAFRDAVEPDMIALTFDDGPDPRWTPEVLDVLEREGVRATFFTVGSQMLKHPDLVRRILGAGHEIGSHTYSHANISRIDADTLRLELNATQSVFETITGRHMALFRAPYAVDTNPRTREEVASLELVTELGYLSIGMDIDPKDWWLPNAGRIERSVLAGARSGTGNIVLLHDGGGDRSRTVEALPGIIAGLRADGFRLVPVSGLLGHTPEQVMPPSQGDRGLLRTFKGAGFGLLREGQWLVAAVFFLAVTIGTARAAVLIGLSFFRRRRPEPDLWRGSVGVVIAAYNEEKVIAQTITSLLASTWRDLDILVVDDGSTDRTAQVVRDRFAGEPRVRVITKANGGKAAALNAGLLEMKTDVVVALDADTVFLPDTIRLLVAHFADPDVAAVAGNAKVGNRQRVLTRLQALEYITSQNLDRRAFDLMNCITVVPGAVGAWHRGRVLAAGGYHVDTLAEDSDLTIRLLRDGYRVAYEDRAIALTEAPETLGQFLKQRFRWMFGMLQVSFKHLGAMKLRDSKAVGLIALPNILVFQLLFSLVAPVADLVAFGILVDLAWDAATGALRVDAGGGAVFLLLFFAFVLLDTLAAAIAFRHEPGEDRRLLLWVVPQRFFYRQLIYFVAIRAALAAIRGSAVGWGALKRSASVVIPADRGQA